MDTTSRQEPAAALHSAERRIVLLIGAIQFVNVLDFMMVMPLGPDFASALHIDPSHIGFIGGAYTASAAVSGVVGSLFLDRFERRRALAFAMLGLAVGTAAGGFATGIESLIAARVVAGAFGGPATSLSLAIIADAVPVERRGKALGGVMAAFSIASVFGVPAGLELSRQFGFRAPFFAVALLSLVMTAMSIRLMPIMTQHLALARPLALFPKVDRLMLISLGNTMLIMLGVFSIVPHLSTYVQYNMGYPRGQIGLLYLIGGVASFLSTRVVGILVDRFGALLPILLGTFFHLLALKFAFIEPASWMPILVIFTLYMLSGGIRMVPMQTLAVRVPAPDQRARFMSVQSALQHMASAVGAFLGSMWLTAEPSGKLIGMDTLAWGAATVAALLPFGVAVLERGLRVRDASRLLLQNLPNLLFCAFVLAFGLFFSTSALACGSSAVGSGVSACSLDAQGNPSSRNFRLGAGYAVTRTRINFHANDQDGKQSMNQQRVAAVVMGEWRPNRRWGVSLGAGGLLAGSLWQKDAVYPMEPGFLGSVAASFIALENRGMIPFVLLSAQVSGVFAKTTNDIKYTATDLRLGAQVGWTVVQGLTPYLSARVFGGPIYWQLEGVKVVGTDAYHYQLGAGVSTLLAGRFDLYVEGIAMGERGVVMGIGTAF